MAYDKPMTRERIEKVLFCGGRKLSDYFLVDGEVMHWADYGQGMRFWSYKADSEALAQGMVEYLRSKNVRECASVKDAPQTS